MPESGASHGKDPPRPVTGGRVGPPTSGMPGSMYDFVRRYLIEHGGSGSRHELLAALQADQAMRDRLARSKGITALLHNMRHSGDVVFDGNRIVASNRTRRRLGNLSQKR